ncbi:helix-turn-helix transcriptional regulator [Streptomyces albiaxialis]|uniref:Helix-turn-helix transcriptional regulator n=1 Tax=Streptomyces albiaxialis TaxID=329523 RepID=A0ABN2W6J0_9ACTN
MNDDPDPSPDGADRTLGTALRRWRDRTGPGDAGLPREQARARRAPGLRREELAALAGVSVDYVIRLEQGRASSPSGQVLAALARALRLTPAERDHLYLLAGQSPPVPRQICAHLTPGVLRLLDQMAATPVGVHDAAWNLVAWNPLYAALMGDPSALRGRERNVPWQHFTGGAGSARVTHGGPAATARFEAAMAADLRAATARYPSDPDLRALVAELRAASARFAALWDTHEVGVHTADAKTVHHPRVGPLELTCDVLTAPGTDVRLVLHTPAPGTDAADKLRLLDVLDTQAMAQTTTHAMTPAPESA